MGQGLIARRWQALYAPTDPQVELQLRALLALFIVPVAQLHNALLELEQTNRRAQARARERDDREGFRAHLGRKVTRYRPPKQHVEGLDIARHRRPVKLLQIPDEVRSCRRATHRVSPTEFV